MTQSCNRYLKKLGSCKCQILHICRKPLSVFGKVSAEQRCLTNHRHHQSKPPMPSLILPKPARKPYERRSFMQGQALFVLLKAQRPCQACASESTSSRESLSYLTSLTIYLAPPLVLAGGLYGAKSRVACLCSQVLDLLSIQSTLPD